MAPEEKAIQKGQLYVWDDTYLFKIYLDGLLITLLLT